VDAQLPLPSQVMHAPHTVPAASGAQLPVVSHPWHGGQFGTQVTLPVVSVPHVWHGRQLLPHLPQLFGSLLVSVHAVPPPAVGQHTFGAGQVLASHATQRHVPSGASLHDVPGGHAGLHVGVQLPLPSQVMQSPQAVPCGDGVHVPVAGSQPEKQAGHRRVMQVLFSHSWHLLQQLHPHGACPVSVQMHPAPLFTEPEGQGHWPVAGSHAPQSFGHRRVTQVLFMHCWHLLQQLQPHGANPVSVQMHPAPVFVAPGGQLHWPVLGSHVPQSSGHRSVTQAPLSHSWHLLQQLHPHAGCPVPGQIHWPPVFTVPGGQPQVPFAPGPV
jgi:hypothetical protein